MASTLEELTALKTLLDQGVLTQEEFNLKKAELLSRDLYSTPAAAPAFNAQPVSPCGSDTAVALDSKSKLAAALLALFLGSLGIHKFYLGYTAAGVTMLLVSLLGALIVIGPVIMGIIAFIEAIIYLTKTDEQFYLAYVVGDRPWF